MGGAGTQLSDSRTIRREFEEWISKKWSGRLGRTCVTYPIQQITGERIVGELRKVANESDPKGRVLLPGIGRISGIIWSRSCEMFVSIFAS
jgi:hypothetical protein